MDARALGITDEDIFEICKVLQATYDPHDAALFLRLPHPLLGQRTPIDCIMTKDAETVLRIIRPMHTSRTPYTEEL